MTPAEARRIRMLALTYGHACYEEGVEEAHDSAAIARARARTKTAAMNLEDALRVMAADG